MLVPIEDPFTLPENALCRNQNGWGRDLYRVSLLITEGTVEKFFEALERQEGSLLGPGHLMLVTDNTEGVTSEQGRLYRGYLIFVPDEENDEPSVDSGAVLA